MELLFERSRKGHHMDLFPPCDVAVRDMISLCGRKHPICRSWMRWSWTGTTDSWKNRHLA